MQRPKIAQHKGTMCHFQCLFLVSRKEVKHVKCVLEVLVGQLFPLESNLYAILSSPLLDSCVSFLSFHSHKDQD